MNDNIRTVDNIGPLTEDERDYLEAYRQQRAARAEKKRSFDPAHVGPGTRSMASSGHDLVTTNDPAAHGFDTHSAESFQCAWYVLGALIRGQHYIIDFEDPEWALKLRYTIETLDVALQQTQDWMR